MISAEKARELLAAAAWNDPVELPPLKVHQAHIRLLDAAPDLAQTVITQADQINAARETINDLQAFGLLAATEADLLLELLKDDQ